MVRLSNYQVTESEMTGMDHFFPKMRQFCGNLRTGPIPIQILRCIIWTAHGAHWCELGYPTPPDHFGYESATSWTGNITYPKYLLINEIGRYSYPNIFPDFYEEWRFYDSDFIRLSFDDNVSNVYSNGNLDVYLTGL